MLEDMRRLLFFLVRRNGWSREINAIRLSSMDDYLLLLFELGFFDIIRKD